MMQIHEQTLKYWALFGFELGRMEFLWHGELPSQKEEFQIAKNNVISMLNNVMVPDETNYNTYCDSILLYFSRENIEIYDCILIGICMQRYQWSLVFNDPKTKAYLQELARSILPSLNGQLIPDREKLYETISMYKTAPLNIDDVCNSIIEMLQSNSFNDTYEDNTSCDNVSKTSPYVFISYSTKNKQKADDMRQILRDNHIDSWMAPYDIPAGSKYAYVINDAIKNCNCFLLMLTKDSQNSPHVEREVERAVSYRKDIIPVQLEYVELNPGFEYYLSTCQIGSVYDLNSESSEIYKVINDIRNTLNNNYLVKSNPVEFNINKNQPDIQNTVYFGKYPYESDGTIKPIEWMILKEEKGQKLLVSKNIIDAVDYHDFGKIGTWEECSLRQKLNSEFINFAFSKEEQNFLVKSKRKQTKNIFYNTSDDSTCEDKVFLLSVEEIKDYFGSQSCSEPTPFAEEKGIFTHDNGLWWIRTPGDCKGMQTYINTVGRITYEGCYQQRREVGLRPAIWIYNEQEIKIGEESKKTEQNHINPNYSACKIHIASDKGSICFASDTVKLNEVKYLKFTDRVKSKIKTQLEEVLAYLYQIDNDMISIDFGPSEQMVRLVSSLENSWAAWSVDEEYKIRFEVRHFDSDKELLYDALHFELNHDLEVSLFSCGNYLHDHKGEVISFANLGIDEEQLVISAKNLIEICYPKKSVKIQSKFKPKFYNDGSGGYHLKFIFW